MNRLAATPPSLMPTAKRNRAWPWAIALALVTLVAYWPAFHSGWLWDDESMVTGNEIVKSPDGLKAIWLGQELPDYFPLTWMSLWLEWKLWGMDPTGYHATNVLLHILSVILVWRVLVALKLPGAWLGALLWAVHPMNVESVAWIEERKNLLPQPFFLMSLLAYIRFREAPQSSTRSRRFYGYAMVSHALALLAKTSIVMQPFVLLGIAWWQDRRITRKDIVRSLPFFVLSFAAGLATIWFQTHHAIADDVVNTNDFLTRLAVAGRALWFYLGKAVLPLTPTFVYPKWQIDGHSLAAHLPWVGFLMLLGVSWRFRGTWGRPLLFALGYFAITILPLLGFLNIYFQKYSYVEDHYQYVPLIAICALAGSLAAHFVRSRKALVFVAVILAGLLVFQTYRYASVYHDIETLWADTLQKNPNAWLVYGDRGVKESDRGNYAEAIKHFQQGLAINPESPDLHQSLGLALAHLGRTNEAMEEYQQALRLLSVHFDTLNAIGALLLNQQKFAEARDYLSKALVRRPLDPDANNNMGYVLWKLGDSEKAAAHFEKAITRDVNFTLGHLNYARFLAANGQSAKAIAEYEEVIRLDPQHAEARTGLGKLLFDQGKTEAAMAHLRAAAAAPNRSAEAEYQLGVAAYANKQMNDAITHWRNAVALDDRHLLALNNLAWVLATDPERHNGEEAVGLAERVVKELKQENTSALDTLAAAYAQAGRFGDAIAVGEKAVALAENNPELKAKLEKRLQMYRNRTPYREQN